MDAWKRLLATSLALGAGSLATACGGGGGVDTPDANVVTIDAEVPDAEPPTPNRSATIAVTDVALTSVQGAQAGMRGAAIDIHFDDITQSGGTVLYGTTTTGGCVVVQYDATHPKLPQVDAGTVHITGPQSGTNGLLKPVGDCNYVAGIGYQCVTAAATSADATAFAAGVSDMVLYTFPGQSFTGDLVGSYLSVNGFSAASGYNSGVSAFPIVGQPASGNQLTVINPAGVGTGADTHAAVAPIVVLNGVGPIPTATGANGDFLGDDSTAIRIQKDANAEWGAIDFEVGVRGEAMALDDTSDQPQLFPTSARDLSFSCGGTNGTCGPVPAGAPLNAIIVSGKTTTADVTATPRDFIMPPSDTWVEWQCGYPLGSAATMPSDAVAAILATFPTRIETRVLSVVGDLPTDANNALNSGVIVVGHGLVGHTTIPQ